MLTMFALSTEQTIGLVAVIAVLGIGAMATPMALMMREYERQGLITGPYDALRRVFRYRWLSEGISLPTPRYQRVQREIAANPPAEAAGAPRAGEATEGFIMTSNR